MFTPLPLWLSAAILSSALLSTALTWSGVYRLARGLSAYSTRSTAAPWPVGLFLVGWLAMAIALGVQGFFQATSATQIPPIAYGLLPPLLVGALGLAAAPTFRKIVDITPPHWIIGVHVLRLVGVVFLILYAQQRLPAVFALPAGVGDALVGSTAPIVAYLWFVRHQWARPLAIVWNVLGLIDLFLAVTLGVLSAPGPLQLLAHDTPNTLITAFPLVVIPTFLVPLWVLLHVYSLRVVSKVTR